MQKMRCGNSGKRKILPILRTRSASAYRKKRRHAKEETYDSHMSDPGDFTAGGGGGCVAERCTQKAD